jgi:hypothetical protein
MGCEISREGQFDIQVITTILKVMCMQLIHLMQVFMYMFQVYNLLPKCTVASTPLLIQNHMYNNLIE